MKNALLIIALSITITSICKFSYSQNDTIIVFDSIYPGLKPSKLVGYDDFLYGTTKYGGVSELGLIYKIGKDGDNFTIIHEFDDMETGLKPEFDLVANQGYLYGLCHRYIGCIAEGILYRINLETNEFEDLCIFSNTGGFFKEFIFHNNTFYIAAVSYWITTDLYGENVVVHNNDFIPLCVEDDYIYGIGDFSGDGYKNLIIYNKQELIYDTLFTFVKNDIWGPSPILYKVDNHLYGLTLDSGINGYGNEAIYKYDLINENIEVIYYMSNPDVWGGIIHFFNERFYCSDGNNVFAIDLKGEDYTYVLGCKNDTMISGFTIIDSSLYYLVRDHNYYESFPAFYVKHDLFQSSSITDNGFLKNISIYPNPAKEVINISNNGISIIEINLYNQFGQKIISKTGLIKQIDITQLEQGIYIVELISRGKRITEKIIIMK
jgi:uncharacterized repeat protein (TIGR03803 family)